MEYKLVFANNAISSFFFVFFLIIDSCFLILVIIVQIFNPIVELKMTLEISIKDAKEELVIHILTAKTRK